MEIKENKYENYYYYDDILGVSGCMFLYGILSGL